VRQLLVDCLFKQGEPLEPFVEAEGLATRFRFHPSRLRERLSAIAEQLRGLPAPFHAEGGGGFTFLGANETRDGELWGEHEDVERLVCLGIAAGFVSYCAERKFWAALPGGMPYFVVDIRPAAI
jgi:hypothetical protein